MKTAPRPFPARRAAKARPPKNYRFPKGLTAQPRATLLSIAARKYAAFLRHHPDERAAMEHWEAAPLADNFTPVIA